MIVHTKYSIGDRVWPVGRATEHITRDCERCKGKGELALAEGGALPCPNRYLGRESCHGGKVALGILSLWHVQHQDNSVVGSVRVERTAKRYTWDGGGKADKNQYMIDATGVGSGRIWDEEDLFPNAEAAQAECDRRNADPAFAEERANILNGLSRRDAESRLEDVLTPEPAEA